MPEVGWQKEGMEHRSYSKKQLIVLLVLVIALPIAILALQKIVQLASHANTVPTHVTVANITPNKFSVAWLTGDSVLGKIRWGTSVGAITNEATDDRVAAGGNGIAKNHLVTVDTSIASSSASTKTTATTTQCNSDQSVCATLTASPDPNTVNSTETVTWNFTNYPAYTHIFISRWSNDSASGQDPYTEVNQYQGSVQFQLPNTLIGTQNAYVKATAGDSNGNDLGTVLWEFPVSYTVTSGASTCTTPANFATSNVTSTTASFLWTWTSTGSDPLSSYQIQENGPVHATFNAGINPDYTVTGLTPGTTYNFSVSAICQNSFSGFDPPTGITFTTPTGNSSTGTMNVLVFNDTNNNNVLDQGETGQGNVVVTLTGPTTTSQTTPTTGEAFFSSIPTGTYTVQITTPTGDTTPQNPQTITVVSTSAANVTFPLHTSSSTCAAPTGVTTTGITSTGATLNWTWSPGSGQTIDHFVVAGNWGGAPTVAGSGRTYTVTGLSPATTYSYDIVAICSNQIGGTSNPTSFTTLAGATPPPTVPPTPPPTSPPTPPPTAPASGSPVPSNSATVAPTATPAACAVPPAVKPGFTRIYYFIESGSDVYGGCDTNNLVLNGTPLYIDIPTNLSGASTAQECAANAIVANCADDAYGAEHDTNGAIVPDVIVTATITSGANTSAPLTGIADDQGHYVFNLGNTTNTNYTNWFSYNPTQTDTITVTGLAADGRTATITSPTSADKPMPDLVFSAATPAPTGSPANSGTPLPSGQLSCAAPQNASGIAVSSTEIDLSWSPASGSASYIVYTSFLQNDGTWSAWQFVPGAGTNQNFQGTSIKHTGLTPNTRYEYFVFSVCPGGSTSNSSNLVDVTTQNASTPAPTAASQTGLLITETLDSRPTNTSFSYFGPFLLINNTNGTKYNGNFAGKLTAVPYSAINVTPGQSYSITLKTTQHLASTKTVTIKPTATTLDFGFLAAGDIAPVGTIDNRDDLIEVLDYSVFKNLFAANPDISNTADLNGNGMIDVVDYSILKANLEKTGDIYKAKHKQ